MPDQTGTQRPASEPADFELGDMPGWPRTVGVISIVWASLGLLCGGLGLLWMVIGPSMAKQAEAQMGGPMPDVMKPTSMQMVLAAVGMIGPVVLLIAGITTLGRKAVGRPLHLVYAALAIVLGGVGMLAAVKQQMQIAAWIQENPSDKWAQTANPTIAYAAMGCMGLLTFAWPVFCIVWFGAMRKRPETGYQPVQV